MHAVQPAHDYGDGPWACRWVSGMVGFYIHGLLVNHRLHALAYLRILQLAEGIGYCPSTIYSQAILVVHAERNGQALLHCLSGTIATPA